MKRISYILQTIFLFIFLFHIGNTAYSQAVKPRISDCMFVEEAPFGKEKKTKFIQPKKINGKYGYVDANGQLALDTIYDYARPFSDDSAAIVKINGNYGIINLKGEFILPAVYECLLQYANGYLKVSKNNKKGLLKNGKTIFPIEYDDFDFFYKGLFDSIIKIRLNNKWGLYSLSGNELLPITYESIEKMNDSLYRLCCTKKANKEATSIFFTKTKIIVSAEARFNSKFNKEGLLIIHHDSTCEIINTNGKTIRKFPANTIVGHLLDYGLVAYKIKNKIGLFNEKGETVADTIYEYYNDLPEWHGNAMPIKQNSKYGLLGHDGTFIISPKYEAIKGYFNTSLLPVKMKDKWGLIDKKENIVMPCIYDEITYYTHDLYGLKTEGKYHMANNKGIILTKELYDWIKFEKSTFPYLMATRNKLYGYIDTLGKEIVPCINESYKAFIQSLTPISISGKWGMANSNNEIIIPCVYDSISTYNMYGTRVKFNGKWGFVDDLFNSNLDFIYDDASDFYVGGMIFSNVRLNNERFAIDRKGNKIR